MIVREWFVRRGATSDRAIVLPDTAGPPSPRQPVHDDYDRKKSEVSTEDTSLVVDGSHYGGERRKRDCPVCGLSVRISARWGTYYSHNRPGTTIVCPQSDQ